MPAIDAKDSKYQVSVEFAPDKADSWAFSVETDGWMVAHNAIRGEISELKAGVTKMKEVAPDGCPGWAVKAIQSAWKAHEAHIHSHHTSEDEIFNPFLATRAKLDDKLEADHKEICALLKDIDGMVKDLKEGESLATILETMEKYESMLLPHLKEEEESALLLMRAYFTASEISPIVQKVLEKGPIVEIGSCIHFMGVDGWRNEFMKQEGIPFFVWYIDFKSRLKVFTNEFVNPVAQLKNGEEAVKKGMFAYLLSFFGY